MADSVTFYMRNVVSVCVDALDDRRMSGRLYCCYADSAASFNGAEELLWKMDALYDSIGYPQSATSLRSFEKKDNFTGSEAVKLMSEKEVIAQKGEKGTFVVQVQYRQNATWQGSVVWAEKGVTRSFRSALELLKLIDGALDEEQIK